jgi:hypothetical protein
MFQTEAPPLIMFGRALVFAILPRDMADRTMHFITHRSAVKFVAGKYVAGLLIRRLRRQRRTHQHPHYRRILASGSRIYFYGGPGTSQLLSYTVAAFSMHRYGSVFCADWSCSRTLQSPRIVLSGVGQRILPAALQQIASSLSPVDYTGAHSLRSVCGDHCAVVRCRTFVIGLAVFTLAVLITNGFRCARRNQLQLG